MIVMKKIRNVPKDKDWAMCSAREKERFLGPSDFFSELFKAFIRDEQATSHLKWFSGGFRLSFTLGVSEHYAEIVTFEGSLREASEYRVREAVLMFRRFTEIEARLRILAMLRRGIRPEQWAIKSFNLRCLTEATM